MVSETVATRICVFKLVFLFEFETELLKLKYLYFAVEVRLVLMCCNQILSPL